jgi:predicted nucleic acid-binding protein
MAAFFLDSSAVVKRYVQEIGAAWFRNLADPASGHFFYIVRITDVEVTAALAGRRRQGSLTNLQMNTALAQFRNDFIQDYRVLEISVPLLERASLLADSHALRAYDAVQLSAALEIRRLEPSVALISADLALNRAASA